MRPHGNTQIVTNNSHPLTLACRVFRQRAPPADGNSKFAMVSQLENNNKTLMRVY